MPASRVIKIGGSLLNLRGLPDLIRRVIAEDTGRSSLVVVGGGVAADVVREWDRTHQLGAEAAHWLAIEAMGLNEALLQRLCPELRLVRSGPQFEKAAVDRVPALTCASCFVRWGEATGRSLPHTWDVTSDTIAAWVATLVGAEELVLVKSTPLPEGCTASEAANLGLVDPEFPRHLPANLGWRWINGREEL